MREILPRHTVVTLSPHGWRAAFDRQPALAEDAFVRDWAAAGHPVVARRPVDSEAREPGVPVGLPTPPSAGKRRIAFVAPVGAIAHASAPVALDAVLRADCFPSAWRPALAFIEDETARLGVCTRVFGSAMWQYLTRLPYVGPSSDVDLLWELPAADGGDVDALLRVLARAQARGGPRIDGEILVNGGAVQWRELAMAEPDSLLLVKSATGARLHPRRRWLAGAVAP